MIQKVFPLSLLLMCAACSFEHHSQVAVVSPVPSTLATVSPAVSPSVRASAVVTPLPTQATCFEPPFLPSRGIELGDTLRIVMPTALMSSPAPRGGPIVTLPGDATVTVIGNPSCFTYDSTLHQREWRVRTADGLEGYVKEYVFQHGSATYYAVLQP